MGKASGGGSTESTARNVPMFNFRDMFFHFSMFRHNIFTSRNKIYLKNGEGLSTNSEIVFAAVEARVECSQCAFIYSVTS